MITRNLVKVLSGWTGGGYAANSPGQACILATGVSARKSSIGSNYEGYDIYVLSSTEFDKLDGNTPSNITYVNTNLRYMMNNLKGPSGAYSYGSSTSGCWTILLGTGTTPATPDDIAVETPISFDKLWYSSWTMISPYKSCGMSNNIQNRSEEDLTVNEVCLCYCCALPTTKDSIAWYYFIAGRQALTNYVLMTREVLDTPIIIPAGQTRTFTVTLNYEDMLLKQTA